MLAIATLLLALLCAGCGSGSSTTTTKAAKQSSSESHATARPPAAPARLTYRPLFTLPAAVQDPATASLGGGRFVLLGGITPAVTSTAAITVANPHGPEGSASLPGAQHDAQAARLGTAVYDFGGGEFTQYDH